MRSLHLLLVLLMVVIAAQEERPKRAVQTRTKRHADLGDSLRPLRRSKRRWVLTTIVLEENDSGPFPKLAGDLFNDRAENYSIRYLVSGPGVDEPPEIGLFHINDHTGQVYVNRPIDREKTPLFVIRFDAAERLTGTIVDKSLIFNVEVSDKNDNAPEFTQSVYDLPLKETANLDNPVFQVKATDIDKEDTPNSDVTYYLVNQIPAIPNVKFSVDPKNGLIRGQGCLNYETSNLIRLIVGARDNGAEPMASTTTVNIRIQDGNNHVPVFTNRNYELSMREGEIKNDLLRLKVEDKDVPKTPAWRAIFKILSGNEKENFNLTTDPETNEGILSMINPLDFEVNPTKTVVISAENEEPFFSCQNTKLRMEKTAGLSTVNVSINVLDSNDAPVFTPPFIVIREKEGLKPGSVLGMFTANDPDKVPNKIRYKIAEDPAGWMTVDENTGVISTLQELDRESPYVNQTLYTVVVHAIDDGEPPGTGTGTVSLYLSDVNDNTPQLVTPYLQICEKQNRMAFVVEAVDKDMDPYSGPFKFEITDQSRSMKDTWQMRQNSGKSVEMLLLQNLSKGNYTIPLTIYDRQGSSSQQVLNVRVCTCPDGETCEKMAPASHQMGGGAIGAIIGALLLFLLALLLLMCFLCGSGGKKRSNILANDEGNQTLINYNEEGGSSLSQQAIPATLLSNGNGNIDHNSKQAIPATLLSNGNGNIDHNSKGKEAVGRILSDTMPRAQYQPWEAEKEAIGRSTSGTIPRAQYQSWETDGAGMAGSGSKRLVHNQTWTQSQAAQSHMENVYSANSKYLKNGTFKKRYDHAFADRIGEMLGQRLQGITDEEEIATYKPRVYAYEGELERIDSVGSFSFPESNMDFSFLDDFDPKFAKLEQICQQ